MSYLTKRKWPHRRDKQRAKMGISMVNGAYHYTTIPLPKNQSCPTCDRDVLIETDKEKLKYVYAYYSYQRSGENVIHSYIGRGVKRIIGAWSLHIVHDSERIIDVKQVLPESWRRFYQQADVNRVDCVYVRFKADTLRKMLKVTP